MNDIEWLTNWYSSNCNGDWEHQFGIKIDTLDNPGWYIEISLQDTEYQGKEILLEFSEGDDDWYNIKSDGDLFVGYSDKKKLPLLIDLFRRFINNQ